ncbi:MAG: methyltransferase [Pseudobdellovibrionaceae bacterium]
MSDAAFAIDHVLSLQGTSSPPAPCLVAGDYHAVFAGLPSRTTRFITPYKGQDDAWRTAGFTPCVHEDVFESALVLAPRQKDELMGLLSNVAQRLMPQGLLMASAPNDGGGRSLVKVLAALGFDVHEASKHKCRVVWGRVPSAFAAAIPATALPHLRDDGLWTQAGVFAWDGIDAGSRFLLQHIGEGRRGIWADFGAGIGVLGRELLQSHGDVMRLDCYEHDGRAVACAGRNLADFGGRAQVIWSNIPAMVFAPLYDGIVMNPPFHAGRDVRASLGQAFITQAYAALKKGGVLLLVANNHLPYETLLGELFAAVIPVAVGHGYKVIQAVK